MGDERISVREAQIFVVVRLLQQREQVNKKNPFDGISPTSRWRASISGFLFRRTPYLNQSEAPGSSPQDDFLYIGSNSKDTRPLAGQWRSPAMEVSQTAGDFPALLQE